MCALSIKSAGGGKQSRADTGNVAELHMTLPEFKHLMMKPTAMPVVSSGAATRGRRRHHHAPVSKAQQAEQAATLI